MWLGSFESSWRALHDALWIFEIDQEMTEIRTQTPDTSVYAQKRAHPKLEVLPMHGGKLGVKRLLLDFWDNYYGSLEYSLITDWDVNTSLQTIQRIFSPVMFPGHNIIGRLRHPTSNSHFPSGSLCFQGYLYWPNGWTVGLLLLDRLIVFMWFNHPFPFASLIFPHRYIPKMISHNSSGIFSLPQKMSMWRVLPPREGSVDRRGKCLPT